MSIKIKEEQVIACLRAKAGVMLIILQKAESVRVRRTTPGPCAILVPDHTAAGIQEHYSQDTVPKERYKDTIFWPNKTPTEPEKELEETKYFTVKSFFNPDKPSGFFIFTLY
ncbi:MAG: hypothetical protein H0W73_09275 [Bacteroidetes bacterium]|nr:hypothetical protein [Bacteroidota bacterium]